MPVAFGRASNGRDALLLFTAFLQLAFRVVAEAIVSNLLPCSAPHSCFKASCYYYTQYGIVAGSLIFSPWQYLEFCVVPRFGYSNHFLPRLIDLCKTESPRAGLEETKTFAGTILQLHACFGSEASQVTLPLLYALPLQLMLSLFHCLGLEPGLSVQVVEGDPRHLDFFLSPEPPNRPIESASEYWERITFSFPLHLIEHVLGDQTFLGQGLGTFGSFGMADGSIFWSDRCIIHTVNP